MTPEYKAEKEASISLLGGGGIWEINHVTLVAPTRQSFFKPYTFPAGVCDFLLHCGAILFATTVYSAAPQVLNGLLILPAVAAYLQSPVDHKAVPKPPTIPSDKEKYNPKDEELDPLPMKPFITTYRGAMMIITCSSILAVDFLVFPRRFAKTESFGTSLMDLGVGSFVFGAGLVAARQQLKEEITGRPSFINRMTRALRTSLPLVLLGLARLYSVKELEYAEHVSEYGVHWNFFFTLGLLPPVMALIQPVLRLIPSYGGVAFFIAICWEIALYMVPGLKVYIILSERKPGDWMSQNREGVFSFIGYFAIFIAGMGIGLKVMPRDPPEEEKRGNIPVKDTLDEDAEWLASVLGHQPDETPKPAPTTTPQPFKPELPKTTIAFLAKWTGLWFLFSVWAMWRYGPRLFVSRRMANLAYIVWVCAFNTAQLLLFCGIEKVMFPSLYKAKTKQVERERLDFATSRVVRAFNRNGLALFLLANLLTGLINMTLPTIHMGDVESMAVLGLYIGTIAGVGVALDHFDISVKL
nr:gpi-anchored wall transfer protein 1 [Quercus suber]